MTNSISDKIRAVMKNNKFVVACNSTNNVRSSEVSLSRLFSSQIVEQNPVVVYYDRTEIELDRDLLHSVLRKIA